LWVTDLTFVPTWAGVAYVCFIVDAYSRMIVGWRVASHMRTTMVEVPQFQWTPEIAGRCGVLLEGCRHVADASVVHT
jgi:Integrase core domain